MTMTYLLHFKRWVSCIFVLWPLTGVVAQTVDMDVPFVTTPQSVSEAMLNIAGVGKDDYVIDLGSGDGRIVILAARKFGARGLGVEIDPQLVETSRVNARQEGVAHRAEFRAQDLFQTDLTRASVITMYLLPDVNIALRPKLLALRPGTRIVSHDWDMGDWPPDAELRVPAPEKKLGLDRTSRVMLWKVPATIDGRWCSHAHPQRTLTLRQRYQHVEGEVDGARAFKFSARLDGVRLIGTSTGEAQLRGQRLVFGNATPLAGAWSRSTAGCAGK
jgi:SAM-dependent methyltransferase